MAARQIIVPGAMPSRDANGRALPAKFRFYVPGATLSTPKTVYTDATLTFAHPFPILSDSAGRWPQMWADEAQFFDVGWTDQVYDQIIGGPFTNVSPADDAVLASVAMAESERVAAEAAATAAMAAQAAAEVTYALMLALVADTTGEPLSATSGSNLLIANNVDKTFILNEPGLLFHEGQTLVAARPSPNSTTQMIGVAKSFDPVTKTLVLGVTYIAGAGTFNSWRISLSGPVDTGIGGRVTALETEQARVAGRHRLFREMI